MLYSVQTRKKKKMKMGSFVHDCTLLLLFALVSASVLSIMTCMATGSGVDVQISDDVLGLIVFKSDITDPFSYLSSWNEDDASPCSWRFIECNPDTSRVTGIFLEGLNLSGKIGLGLQKLQHLKVLSLSDNSFRISPSLVFPGSLQRLNLSSNGLTGHLPPSLLNMSSIFSLDLADNSLSGQIADDFFSGCSSGLRFLSLSGNMFDGPVPNTLSSCSLLNTLNLSNNHFSGNPSSGLWTLQRLRVLDLSGNQLSGPLPTGVSLLHYLKQLLLRSNQFSGPIPSDLGQCFHLSILDLSNNQFTGALPESLQELSSLSLFSVSNNFLSGDFPEWIGKLSSLKTVDLSDNGLSGSIPASLAYCSTLSVVKLRRNNLSGDIPTDLFNLGLEEIDFSHNGFTGLIPQGASNLFRSLRVLDLSKNNLTGGMIPAAEMTNLQYLNLSWNNLQSKMPAEIGYLKNLSVVDLRSSGIYGFIPSDICDSGSLRILQLDLNSLTGIIPHEIGNCSSLYLLSLSHNKLTGLIPGSISMLEELKILKLEKNELIGEIPQSLGRLQNLLLVNVSYNRLVGRLPNAGIFPSLDRTALEGNLGICSPLLTGPCQMDVPKPLVLDPNSMSNQGSRNGRNRRHEDVNSSQHRFLSVSAIVAISAAVLIACGVILITVLNASTRRRMAFVDAALESIRSMSSSKSGTNLPFGKFISFDTKSSIPFFDNPFSLLNKASEIGEGTFGTVYNVLLGEQAIAVKRLFTSTLTQYHEDFDREVRVLGKARHPNLVTLKGYYWTPELQLLVTEFAPNGSLQSKLQERLPLSSPPLSWAMRLKIVLGIAKGLAHLHHSFSPPIIHYNIKPSNILLDQSYNAKISDFGLARFLTKHFPSTPGYVAPEVTCQSLRVNEKCDVYSFGMLILEIVTGRRPIEYGEESVLILNDHVRVLLEDGNVLECVDSSMGEYLEDEVLPVVKLALVCTSQVPSSRPSMAEVVQILQVIKTPVTQRML